MHNENDQRFVVDWMLMKLGRWLRLLGQDVALPAGKSDEHLMIQAREECRTIITRDKRLFLVSRKRGLAVHLISSNKITEQLMEMAEKGVPLRLDPHRCTVCNGPLQEMESARAEKLRWKCKDCKKVYWEGGHWKRIESMLEEVRSRRVSP